MHIERHAVFWIAAGLAFALALKTLAPVLLPFAAGLTLAYFLNPVVDRLASFGLPRIAGAILLLLLSAAAIVTALVFLLPLLAEQSKQLIAALPEQTARLKTLAETMARDQLGDRFPEAQAALSRAMAGMTDALPGLASSIAQSLWSQGAAAFSFLSLILITPLVAFYALVDWPKIVAKVDSWLPLHSAPQIRAVAADIDTRVSAFIRGQGIVCLVLAAFYAAALSALGLKYGLLVGLLTGLLSFIPFAGWALGLISALALAVVQFWPDVMPILLVGGVFLGGQVLDAALLSPQIVGSKIGLHPVWLIFALLTFSYLFGFLGMLVAVPVAAAIGVLVRFALDRYMHSSVYRGDTPSSA